MSQARAWVGQALLYAAFALAIGIFSQWPEYEHLAPERALIKLSFIHHGRKLEECRRRTPEELAKLPPNMRAPMQCGRERAPVIFEVDIDGAPALRVHAPPTGLRKDGAASAYERLETSAGKHLIAVRMKDSARTEGFDFEHTATIDLAPAQIRVIDFDAERGGIALQ